MTPASASTPSRSRPSADSLLGVCLGMQSMAAAFGAEIVRAPTLVHGEATEVTHDGAGLLEGMPPAFMARAITPSRSIRRPSRPSSG